MIDYPTSPPKFDPARAERGQRLLAAGLPIRPGDPAFIYLTERRQLPAEVIPAAPDLLYLPSSAGGRGPGDHAVLSVLRVEPGGDPSGLQTTWIDITGAPAPVSGTQRKRAFFSLVEHGCRDGCWWAGEGKEIVAAEGYLEKPLALIAAGIKGRVIGFGSRSWLKFKRLNGTKLTTVADRAPGEGELAADGSPLRAAHLRDYGANVDHWLLNGFADRVWITPDPPCGCCKDADDLWRAHGAEGVLKLLARAAQGELGRGGWIARLARIGDELERQAAIKEAVSDATFEGKPLFKGVPIKLVREHVAAERARLRQDRSDPDRPDVEPWETPIDDLAAVLDALVDELARYIAADAASLAASALWCAMTHVFDRLHCMPKLALQSPTKQCGKTTLLDCLSGVVRRPELTSGVTAASFIRTSDAWRPTWLMDEADRYLDPKTAGEALTAAINASSYRRLARKKVCVPNAAGGWDMQDFEFWCPMVLAGIKELVDTVQDRSIVLRMQRAKPGELRFRLVDGTSPVFEQIQRKLVRWAKDLYELDLDPEVPTFLHNREADLWRPLLSIAALAGRDWPERAKQAAMAIHGQRAEDEVRLTLLLEAIREEFGTSEQMFAADLVARLIAREGEPWATIKRNGQPIDAYYLRGMLKGVVARDPEQREKGRGVNRDRRYYTRASFEEAWARYISVDPANDPAHPAHPAPETANPQPQPDSVGPDEGNSSGPTQALDKPTENSSVAVGPDGPDRIRRDANIYPAAGNGADSSGHGNGADAPGCYRCAYCGIKFADFEPAVVIDGLRFHVEACPAEYFKRQQQQQRPGT